MNKLEYSKEDLIEMQNDIDKLQQALNKKNKIIEEIKEDIENAINEAINNKINLEINTNNRGRYDAYVYVLDKIEELERSDNNE